MKTVFLIAITSALCVRELQALSVQPPFASFFPDKLVLWTKAYFFSKVVTTFHVGQSITLLTLHRLPIPAKRRKDYTAWTLVWL